MRPLLAAAQPITILKAQRVEDGIDIVNEWVESGQFYGTLIPETSGQTATDRGLLPASTFFMGVHATAPIDVGDRLRHADVIYAVRSARRFPASKQLILEVLRDD